MMDLWAGVDRNGPVHAGTHRPAPAEMPGLMPGTHTQPQGRKLNQSAYALLKQIWGLEDVLKLWLLVRIYFFVSLAWMEF